MDRTTKQLLLCVAAAGLSTGQLTNAGPSFQGLGDLPGGFYQSQAWGLSADGSTIVGYSWSSDPNWDTGPLGFEAMRWSASEGMVGLGGLPSLPDSSALSVSGNGTTVAGWARYGNGIAHPFRWTAQNGMEALPGLTGGDGSGVARGISANGSVIVGASNVGLSHFEAVRWTNGGVPVPLGSTTSGADRSEASGVSADGSVIVGDGGSHFQAFRWTEGNGVSLLGILAGDTQSGHPIISGDGSTIAGQSSRFQAITSDAFLWHEASGMVPLAPRPVGIGVIEPRGISFDGSVIVGNLIEEDPFFFVHPFIWSSATGLRDLEDVLVNDFSLEEAADWHLGYATGISADGQVIVGSGVNPSGDQEAWIATVPEPSMLCLVSILACVLTVRRRERCRDCPVNHSF